MKLWCKLSLRLSMLYSIQFDLKAQFSRPHMSSYQAHNDAVNNVSLFVDSVGSPSSLDDIFTCLLTLTTYLRRRLVHFIGEW
jgi:hypothetical protein